MARPKSWRRTQGPGIGRWSPSKSRYATGPGVIRCGAASGSTAGGCRKDAGSSSPRSGPPAMTDLATSAWPLSQLGEALQALARRAGLRPAGAGAPSLLQFRGEHEDLERWLEWAGARLGIEVESVEADGSDVVSLLRGAGPALLRYRRAGQQYVLLLLKATARAVQLIGPDLRIRKCPLGVMQAALCEEAQEPVVAEVEALLTQAGIPVRNRLRVQRALMQERLSGRRFGGCWMLRPPPTGSFWAQALHARLPRRLLAMIAVFAGVYLLEIAGWTLIGQGALGGRVDPGWLVA